MTYCHLKEILQILNIINYVKVVNKPIAVYLCVCAILTKIDQFVQTQVDQMENENL